MSPAQPSRAPQVGTEAAPQPTRAYRLLYSCMLVVTYLSVMVDLFLIVINHGPAVALKAALGLLVFCAALSLIPFALFVRKTRKEIGLPADLKTLWNIYSWRGAGPTERALTAVVFATVMIALALIVSHGYIH